MDPDEIQRAILRDVYNRVSRGEHPEANPAYYAKELGITEIEAKRNLKHLIETGALDGTVKGVIGGSYFFVEDITANGEQLMKQQEAIQPALPETAAPKADLKLVKTPTYLRALALLAIIVIIIVFGIPFVIGLAFVIDGMNSIGYYGPPIGQVMSFYYMAATLLAEVSAGPAAILAALLASSKVRKFFASPFEQSQPKDKPKEA